jgi:hypothetical protein
LFTIFEEENWAGPEEKIIFIFIAISLLGWTSAS